MLKGRLASVLVFTLTEGITVFWYIVMHYESGWGVFLCNMENL